MRKSISLIILSATCLLASCTTAYQPDGISGGYSDKMLAGNTAQVTFRGNRLTTPDSVHSFLLRRCAEVTVQDGYRYFAVAHEEAPNQGNTDNFGSRVGTATITMYQGKPPGDSHVYDAPLLLRELLAQQGEADEPLPAAVVARVNPEMPQIPGSTTATNPNAKTNDPVHFENW